MPGHPGLAFGRPECKPVPGIHAFRTLPNKTWMAGPSPAEGLTSARLFEWRYRPQAGQSRP
jgi:hypothetical protein